MNFSSDSLSFFKESISSYTKNAFSKYESNLNIIYSKNFENDCLCPLFVNLLSLFRKLIKTNNLSQLWTDVADSYNQLSEQLIKSFDKEINSKNVNIEEDSNGNIICKDKDYANINKEKFKILSTCLFCCIKRVYNDTENKSTNKLTEEFNWFKQFLGVKGHPESEQKEKINNFIDKYVLTIPEMVNSKYSSTIEYFKWIGQVIIKTEINNQEINNIIKEKIDEEKNKYYNAFAKMLPAPRERKLSRSRGASFDKNEYNLQSFANNDKKDDRNYKLEKYFKKEQPQKKQNEKEPSKSSTSKDEENNSTNTHKNSLSNEEFNDGPTIGNNLLNSFPSLSFGNIPSFGSSTNLLNNLPTINLNSMNDDTLSQLSSSRMSISKRSSALDTSFGFRNHYNTSMSFYSNDLEDNLSYTQHYSFSGINSLLHSKASLSRGGLLSFPTIKRHRSEKRKKKEYSSSIHYKFASQLAQMTKSNDENLNSVNVKKTKEKNNETKKGGLDQNIRNFINTNFYKNSHQDRDISQNENESTKAKSKEKKSKIQKNDDILVYRTPIKENSFYKAPSEIKGLVSPDTTKKNLLLLFQQVNK